MVSIRTIGQREGLATLASQSWKVVAGPREGSRGLEQNAGHQDRCSHPGKRMYDTPLEFL